jgi:signal transduction histidine kinase
MITENTDTIENLTLRQRAEQQFKLKHSKETPYLNETETNKFIYELEIHEIELNMQNEALILANEKSEAAAKKYAARYDFAPMGYFALEKDGTIVELNISGSLLLAKERNSLLQSNFKLFVTEETRGVFNSFLQRVIETEVKETCEIQFLENEQPSRYIYLEGISYPMEKKYLITAIDITEQKKAEWKIKLYTEELERVNAAKDKFFSIIADDLRTPFLGIITISELLEGKLLSDNNDNSSALLKYVQIIHNSSKSVFTVLDNLMDWSKAQTGDISYNSTSKSIKRIIESTVPNVATSAFKKNITIENALSDDELVFVDEVLIDKVIRNLLMNAIKFTFYGGKIILSSIINKDFLEVSVTDTGVGIDSQNLEKIFRIESRFSKHGTENEAGSGLGLILCKEFVEKQGGKIWIESTLGKGTVATFTLPLARKAM